jgi:WS/DGAT/MGAT family acyltransferase
LNKPLSAGRSFVCDSLPLASVKAISKGFGVTINDVFLSCVAGTLRRYLADSNYAVDSGALIAGVPFSLDRDPGREILGNFSTKDTTWLHTEIEDPLERLQASGSSAREMKAHLSAVLEAGADIGSVVQVLPPVALTLLGKSTRSQVEKARGGLFGNVVVSNVPGPRESLYLKDYTLDNWFSIGQVFDGANLNFTLWSYRSNANLCILADSQVVPDAWVLFDYFSDEVNRLLALVPDKLE